MSSLRTGSAIVCFLVMLLGSELFGQPANIDTFPYEPDESQQASHFIVNYGSGPTTSTSHWSNGTISSPRQGTGGTSVQAWANEPTANYSLNSLTWLHSPIFDFTGVSGLQLEYELWIRTNTVGGVNRNLVTDAGLKLQVSTNGGSTWTDVTTSSLAYNGTYAGMTTFGGSSDCWKGTALGGGSANTCRLDLNPWAGESDVRFRWCFRAQSGTLAGTEAGPVLDSFRIVPVDASVAYAGGYSAVPQGDSVLATLTKTGGSPFVSGMTVSFSGTGLVGTVNTVVNDNVCTVDVDADRIADAGMQFIYINDGSTRICEGQIFVYHPHQLIAARESGSTQEPPRSATMGANGVYLHNGEFRHDLPFLSIPGRMLPLTAGGTYRSQLESIGWLGAGWTASFDQKLYYDTSADDVMLYSGNGRIDLLTRTGGTAQVGPYTHAGFFFNIYRDDNSTPSDFSDDVFTIHYAHGSTATFEAVHEDVGGRWTYRITAFSDRFGNTIEFVYDVDGYLEEIRGDLYDSGDPTRYRLLLDYNSHGRLHTITDYANYTGQQSVIGSSYTGPRVWEFVYNTDAQLIEIKLPKTERYDSETKGGSYRTRVQFTYDSTDNMLEVIDARQANESSPYGWLKNTYDSGKVDYQDVGRTSGADTTHRQYIVADGAVDQLGRQWINVVNAEGHRSDYRVQVSGGGGGPFGTLSTVRHYTAHWDSSLSQTSGKVRSSDPDYFETSYQYDTQFNVIRVDHPRGNRTQFRYDIENGDQRSKGNLLRVLAHPGTASTTGLPANQVNGLLATFTYTSASQFNLLATSVSPRAYELKSTYDITTHNSGDIEDDQSAHFTTTNTYYFSHGTYPDGTLQKTTSPAVDDTLIPETLNDGQYLESVFTYNAFGQVLTVEDQVGHITEYEYGTSGFGKGYLATVKNGAQSTPLYTNFGYNSVGRVITVQDPKGETWTSYVNQLDQVVRSETPQVSAQMPMGNAATYFSLAEYDLNGNLEVSKVSNINEYGTAGSPSTFSTTYTYNILDMVTSVTEPIDGSTSRTFTFEYDLIYRSSESTLPEGNKSATDYDELNRAIKSHAGYGNGVAKGSALITGEVFYDHNSNVIKAVDGRGNESDFTYDALDRLIKSQDRLTTDRNYTEYVYNRAGQVVEVTRKGNKRTFNGIAFSTSPDELLAQSQTFYDNLGRAILSRVRAIDATGSALGYGILETAHNYEVGPSPTLGWSNSRVKFRDNGQVESVFGDLSDSSSVPLSYETKYEYDAYRRLARVIDDRDGGGASTSDDDNWDQYTYDANGNVTSVMARLYDDAGFGTKTVTTYFFYDEINRLIEDESPVVDTVLPNGTISTGSLKRYYKYDSRSNLVRTYDRKGVERITQYDRINRPIRHKITDVEQRVINPSTGLLSTVVRDIASRTEYDKNSNVIESIGPTGNRTYFRYDQAGRWLQTQHADGGGTPNKTTAGSGHSITQVGSSVFYSKTGAYDGNSNLLKITDENGTETTWTYDANDLMVAETGSAAGGNPFGIEGETGFEYLYDGMYRSVRGRSYDGAGTLTEVDSVFNTLGGLERQRQKVHRAHPNHSGFEAEGTVLSRFDESGRRYERTNPSGLTRVSWKFDRKHRPTETWQEFNTGSWQTASLAAEYEYLGGGLLHSRQTRYIKQHHPIPSGEAVFPIVSTFERDDLLRITRVRHTRDDGAILRGSRMLGRYQYAYDANSMMTWEARWYHDDELGSSVTPDETDFYFYDTANRLEKAVYSATKYGGSGTGIEIANFGNAYVEFGDDQRNGGTYSDRVYYGRRMTGTRDSVNWYRGTADGTSSAIGQDDTSTGPQQTTSYNTSDSTTADVDNPTSDGGGSRHNYTAIGQVGLDYDNNRNVLADGTRQFRYNYRNQLRRVWRKSDGESDGALAQYREDAYGRRVYAHTHWELGRRVYFDTRFELDVDMDDDGDTTEMEYVAGGITSTASGMQVASWPSRLSRPVYSGDEHYIDFLVDVPDFPAVPGPHVPPLLGFVGYGDASGRWQLEIYAGGWYELWFRDGSNDTLHTATSGPGSGRLNIGLRFDNIGNSGVWINGSQLISGLASPQTDAQVYFGTATPSVTIEVEPEVFQITHGDPITLLENLTYLRSFNRTADPEESIPDGPRVTVTFFDGPQPVTITEVVPLDETYVPVPQKDVVAPGVTHLFHDDERDTRLELVNGRRTTAHVIRAGADRYGRDGDSAVDMGSGNEAPGTSALFVADGEGAIRHFARPSPADVPKPVFSGGNLEGGSVYDTYCTPIHQGVGGGPASPGPGSAPPSGVARGAASAAAAVNQSAVTFNSADRECACAGEDPSNLMIAASTIAPETGLHNSMLGGSYVDWSARVTGQAAIAPIMFHANTPYLENILKNRPKVEDYRNFKIHGIVRDKGFMQQNREWSMPDDNCEQVGTGTDVRTVEIDRSYEYRPIAGYDVYFDQKAYESAHNAWAERRSLLEDEIRDIRTQLRIFELALKANGLNELLSFLRGGGGLKSAGAGIGKKTVAESKKAASEALDELLKDEVKGQAEGKAQEVGSGNLDIDKELLEVNRDLIERLVHLEIDLEYHLADKPDKDFYTLRLAYYGDWKSVRGKTDLWIYYSVTERSVCGKTIEVTRTPWSELDKKRHEDLERWKENPADQPEW